MVGRLTAGCFVVVAVTLTQSLQTASPRAVPITTGVPVTSTSTTTTTLPDPGRDWDTTDTDPTAYWPSSDDPIRLLARDIQRRFACIRWMESRNHPTSVSYAGAGGLYQIMPLIWRAYGGLVFAPSAQEATPQQQGKIAATIWKANRQFYPEWQNACTQKEIPTWNSVTN